MKRAGAGVAMIVVALTLVAPPAAAQNQSARLYSANPQPKEFAGEVVITVTMWRAARVSYRTFDGSCTVDFLSAGSPPASCASDRKARAPEDYTATSGDLVFTDSGTMVIKIPIVDDGVAEGDEAFTFAAWEEANADPWIRRGDSLVVNIADDEVDPRGSSAAPSAGSAPNAKRAEAQSSGSSVSAAASPLQAPGAGVTADAATTTTAPPPPRFQVESPDDGMRPGPGFELTGERAPEASERGGGAGGSASGLVIGSGTAALGVAVLAVSRRRRRWSPTRE